MKQTIDTKLLDQKRDSVVKAFLLLHYRRIDSAKKQAYEVSTRAERIARTMRLEGEQVTDDDVRQILHH